MVTACFAILVTLFALSVFSQKVSAADENQIIVYGYVKDAGGTGIVGADVLIEMTSISHSVTTTTSGYYTWTFQGNEWEPGDTIVVTATYNSEQVFNDPPYTTIAEEYIVHIDLQFTTGVPEFGTLVGFFAASGLVASVALVLLGVKREDT